MVKKTDFSLTLMLDEKPKVVTSEDPPNKCNKRINRSRYTIELAETTVGVCVTRVSITRDGKRNTINIIIITNLL